MNQNNILFDMSVNARDLPAKGGKPAQTAVFIQCQQNLKEQLKCPTFEDYYPGDKYVDLMGVTFYNRGKGNSNRRRGTPDQIVNAAGRKTLDRLKNFNKPIFVDEVGTTAVNYT
ncbi:MAG: glycosyl hydrolase [bacterium]